MFFHDFYKGDSDFEISEVINRGGNRKHFFEEISLFPKSQNLRFFFFSQISDFRFQNPDSRIQIPESRISEFLKIAESENLRLQDMQLLWTPHDHLRFAEAKYEHD